MAALKAGQHGRAHLYVCERKMMVYHAVHTFNTTSLQSHEVQSHNSHVTANRDRQQKDSH